MHHAQTHLSHTCSTTELWLPHRFAVPGKFAWLCCYLCPAISRTLISESRCHERATLIDHIFCPWEVTARGFPEPHAENSSVLLPYSGYSGQFLGFLLALIFSEAPSLALASGLSISRTPSTHRCSKNEESARWVWFVPTSVCF